MENNDKTIVPANEASSASNPHASDSSMAYSTLAEQTYLLDDVKEKSHLDDVCRAYRQYAAFAVKQFGLLQSHRVASLPQSYQDVLPDHLKPLHPECSKRLKAYRDAAIRNQFCLDCILRHAGKPHSQQQQALSNNNTQETPAPAPCTEAQMSKVSSVLKSLTRDWSVEGQAERDACFAPIFESLQRFLPVRHPSRPPKLCVPGAGVGRLAAELVARGYTVQGNEFSLYMLLASDFILNGPTVAATAVDDVSSSRHRQEDSAAQQQQQSQKPRPLSISPWLLETRNVHGVADPVRSVQIPDVDPFDMIVAGGRAAAERPTTIPMEGEQGDVASDMTSGAEFSMAAGEFCSIYGVASEGATWDCVVACFFLDASPVIVQYLHVVYHMLKPGGLLINFGPLHWHWSGPAMLLSDESMQEYQDRYSYLDPKYMQSVDFCWEDIKTILVNIGFELLEIKGGIPAAYTADSRSMLQTEYRCTHFCARKGVKK